MILLRAYLLGIAAFCFTLSVYSAIGRIRSLETGSTFILEKGDHISGHGRFISPNELSPYLYADLLKDKGGALISVGSFRALIGFAMGNFDYAFFIDFDESIALFNKANLNLIKHISSTENLSLKEQRFLYLAVLNNRWLADSEIKRIAKENDGGKTEIVQFLNNKKKCSENVQLPTSVPKFLADLEDIYRRKERDKPFGQWLCDIGQSLKAYYHPRYLERDESNYYWEDDEKWLKVVRAIKEERIAIVSGRVDGDISIPAIANTVKILKTAVSVIDLSNIPSMEWVAEKQSARSLTRNIYDLPKTSDAVVLYTAQPYDLHPRNTVSKKAGEDGNWGYYFLDRDKMFYIAKIGL